MSIQPRCLHGPVAGTRPYRLGRRSFGFDPTEPLERQRWRSARDAVRNVFELAVATLMPSPALRAAG